MKNILEYIVDRSLCEDSPVAPNKQGILLLRTVKLTAEAFHSCSVCRLSLRHVALTACGLFLQYLHPENRLTTVLLSRSPKWDNSKLAQVGLSSSFQLIAHLCWDLGGGCSISWVGQERPKSLLRCAVIGEWLKYKVQPVHLHFSLSPRSPSDVWVNCNSSSNHLSRDLTYRCRLTFLPPLCTQVPYRNRSHLWIPVHRIEKLSCQATLKEYRWQCHLIYGYFNGELARKFTAIQLRLLGDAHLPM